MQCIATIQFCDHIVMMSIMNMRGPVYVLFFHYRSRPVPVRELFGKYPTRSEVKNLYSSGPGHDLLKITFFRKYIFKMSTLERRIGLSELLESSNWLER